MGLLACIPTIDVFPSVVYRLLPSVKESDKFLCKVMSV